MKEDRAVSPVIAVILMVAITVVLAAVVYTWVSGFGQGNVAPRSMGLMSNGATVDGNASFTVTSASPGLLWNELQFLVNGTAVNATTPTGDVSPGETFTVPSIPGTKFIIIDVPANAAISTLTLR